MAVKKGEATLNVGIDPEILEMVRQLATKQDRNIKGTVTNALKNELRSHGFKI